MLILHTSDLHGDFERLLHTDTAFDVWVDTGDFFPNLTRGEVDAEVRYQTNWMAQNDVVSKLVTWLNGRPMISVPGNHDYVSLVEALQSVGVEAHEVTPTGVEVAGFTWAGFREIPWIYGEWNGETHNFDTLVETTWATRPDVLVTHAPAGGLLDGGNGYGIATLASALTWQPHNIKAHFFGHSHEHGGQTLDEMGVLFANGATTIRVHTLE